jgi:hypothetical protein
MPDTYWEDADFEDIMEEELNEFILSDEGETVDYTVLEPHLESATEHGMILPVIESKKKKSLACASNPKGKCFFFITKSKKKLATQSVRRSISSKFLACAFQARNA